MFQPRRYQVTGTQPVLDHEPGSVFEADIDPTQEERLLASGALRRLDVPAEEFPPPLDVEPTPNPEQAATGRDAALQEE